jgi:Heparinase II/III-like protein
MPRNKLGFMLALGLTFCFPAINATAAVEYIPAVSTLKKDHPRLLIRPKDTSLAISLKQLKSIPRDADFKTMLAKLRSADGAAPPALAWLLTGEKTDAEKSLGRIKAWKKPNSDGFNNPFRIYFGCFDMALAYDWLYNYPGFDARAKAEMRAKVLPLAQAGAKQGNDHIFHNYVHMWNGGAMLWALATAGEDPGSDKIYKTLRERYNKKYFPAFKYLAGQPADSQGYWSLYCLSPLTHVLLGAQSACQQDLIAKVKLNGDWLKGQLENLVHTSLPNQRYVPWGDMQSGGDGGITHEMACNIDMMTWATKSKTGAYLSKWLTGVRGANRFYGITVMHYFLYTRNLPEKPETPSLTHFAGGKHGGHWLARDKWSDDATIVAFRCNDCYTGHNHHDQGNFVIYRKGLLALDAGYYKRPRGAQQKTHNHNTLLFGGQGQRYIRPRGNNSLESYKSDLKPGKRSFETGNILFQKATDNWSAIAGQFGQAYDSEVVGKAVRQLLFIRPTTIVVVDHLEGPVGKPLPDVSWLLHLPAKPQVNSGALVVSNGKSWLHCRPLLPLKNDPEISEGARTQLGQRKKSRASTWQATYKYKGTKKLKLLHVITVGEGTKTGAVSKPTVTTPNGEIHFKLGGKTYIFSGGKTYSVNEK